MKIKQIVICHVESKTKVKKFPVPSFFNDGFVFIKLISDELIEGLGEPSPYLFKPKVLLKKIENIYKRYFKDKKIDLNFVKNLKKKKIPYSVKMILPAFEHAIFSIFAKQNSTSVSNLINKKKNKKSKISFYASGGMIFENQSYEVLINEALRMKIKNYDGYKFRPKLPLANLSHAQRIKHPPKIDTYNLKKFSEKLRLKVGPDFKLMIDLGCRCKNIKEGKYLIDLFKELNFFFVEEPFKRKLNIYKNFSKFSSPSLIAMGEHSSDLKEFNDYNKNKCFQFFQPDTNLFLYSDIRSIYKKISSKRLILHNWCNKINFVSNISLATSFKEEILVEKNILNNPFESIFNKIFDEKKKLNVKYDQKKNFNLKLKKKDLKKFIYNEKKF